MEARIARLESDVTHLLSDVADIKAHVRGLRDRVEIGNTKSMERTDSAANRLDHQFDKVASDMDAKFQRLGDKIDRLTQSLARTQVWAVLLCVALAGGLAGTMARGFGWM
jgi:hypothetical protein